jgi:RNA polymerase sigma factor (sigma-70 family)
MRIVRYTDDELIRMIRDGHNEGFTSIYEYHKEYCMNFMKSKYSDHDEIQDIFQDAVLVLYEKVQDSEFKLTCSIQTYLNSICRNQILVRLQKSGRFVQKSEDGAEEYIENISDWFEDPDGVNQERVKTIQDVLLLMKSNSSKCYDMLVRFWYRKQTMSKIANDLGYTNAENAKNQKARCQQKLKLEVFKRMRRG